MLKLSWPPSGRRQMLTGAVLIGVLVALFLPGLIGGKILCFRDNLADHLGWRLLAVSELAHGHLPLIDPTIDAGIPMLADPNTMVFYPTTWLFAVLPPPVALAFHDLLHQLLLALGAYFLLRRMGHARRSSLAGATFAAGAGIAFSQLAFTNSIATLAWMPWLIRTAIRLPKDAAGTWRRAASATAFGALAWYAGEPVIAAMGWLVWLLALIFEPNGSPLRNRLRLLAAPLLAAALAAPLLIPFLSIYPTSHRAVLGLPHGSIGADAFRPARWPELLLPHLYGAPGPFAPDGFWAAPSFPWIRYEVNLHVGTVALALLLLGAWGKKTRWWTALLLAATILAAAPGLLVVLARLIPPLASFRYAIKLLLLGFLAAIPILARGVSAARRRPRTFRRISAVLGVITLILAAPLATPKAARTTLSMLHPASAANLASPGVAASIARSVRQDAVLQLLPLAAAVAAPQVLLIPSLAAQLVLEGRSMLIWDGWKRYGAPSPVMVALGDATRTAEQIVTPVARLLPKPVPGVPSPIAQGRLEFAQAWRFYGVPYGVLYRGCLGPDGLEPWWSADTALRLAGTRSNAVAHAARHLGVDAILRRRPLPASSDIAVATNISAGGSPISLMRLARPAPAAWMAARQIVVPSRMAAWRQLEDPASVPGADAVTLGRHSGVVPYEPGSLRLLERTPSQWRIRTNSPGPALLVLDQAFSPRWKVRIDGHLRVPALVNLCRLGIRLPAGAHTVTVTWSRVPFFVGLGVAGAGLVILLMILCLPRRKRNRRSPSGAPAPRPPAIPRQT
ncbi:MAG: hypothetical protein GXP48_07490 [Acidobacteria bacterium]|nr:hypothetical protein [Acidobacteriota bacterium]